MSEVRGLIIMCGDATLEAAIEFVTDHADVISRFRVTAPMVVLDRIRHLLGENADKSVGVAPNYLGGDAQVATQVVLHDVGAAIIFRDPIGASGAACDCDALLRLLNVHNIINATNPATADMLVEVLREGMTTSKGEVDVMPSFYESLESPAVAAYKAKQNAVIAACSSPAGGGGSTPGVVAAAKPTDSASLPAVTEPTVGQIAFSPDFAFARDLVWSDPAELLKEASHKAGESVDFMNGSMKKLFKLRSSGRGSMKFQLEKTKTFRLKKVDKLKAVIEAVEIQNMLAGKIAKSRAVKDQDEINMQQAESMRCLALISHNNMKGAMKEFVIKHKEILKRFRLTGTNSTMTMLKSTLGEKGMVYGPTCSSGPLGGDAEVGALMCIEDLGGMFFFTDPLDPHPHAADINALIRMADLHNLMHASNPSTGDALIRVLKKGLSDPTQIPTFYTTAMSPAIGWHESNPRGALYLQPSWFGDKKYMASVVAQLAVCSLAVAVGAYLF